MRYARIFDVHIPLERTDAVFKCTELEIPLAKAKWEGSQRRDKSRPIVANAMSLTGQHDPFRPVDDVETEMRRLQTVWGKKNFEKTYQTMLFEQLFGEKTVEQNSWSIARAKAEAEAQAQKDALGAAATAKLVHEAIQMRVHADAEQAQKRLNKHDEVQEQAAKDREALAAVGVTDDDLVGSAPSPATTHSPKPRKG